MFTIYKITQVSTGLVYIGQTKLTIEQRFRHHVYAVNNHRSKTLDLYRQMSKDTNDFRIEPLDTADTRREALDLEQRYIEIYDSRDKTKGFNRDRLFHEVSDTQRACMSHSAKHRKTKVKQSEESKARKRTAMPHRKPVRCNETGDVFESISQAAKWCGTPPLSVRQILQGKRKRTRGYSFSYVV